MQKLHRYRAVIGLALVLAIASACASTGISLKQKATTSIQTVEIALGAADDFERAAFVSKSIPQLTPDVHQKISKSLAVAFGAQVRLAKALQSWKSGDPAPSDIKELSSTLHDAIAAIGVAVEGTPAADLVAKINKVLVEVASLAATIGATL